VDLNFRCYIIAVTLIPEKSIVILRGPTKCYAQDYDFKINFDWSVSTQQSIIHIQIPLYAA